MPTGQWTRMIGGSKLYQPANFSLRGPDTGGWAGYYQERHSGTWTEEYNGWFAWKLDSSMNIPADLEVDVWIGPDSKIELQWYGSNDLELQLMEWEWHLDLLLEDFSLGSLTRTDLSSMSVSRSTYIAHAQPEDYDRGAPAVDSWCTKSLGEKYELGSNIELFGFALHPAITPKQFEVAGSLNDDYDDRSTWFRPGDTDVELYFSLTDSRSSIITR